MSAGAGQEALDGLSKSDDNPNGVFTRVFAPLLLSRSSLLDAIKTAQLEVFELARGAGHLQQPAYYDEVRGQPCLGSDCDERNADGNSTSSTSHKQPLDDVMERFELARKAGTVSVWDTFLAQNPPEPFASFGRSEKEKLTHVATVNDASVAPIGTEPVQAKSFTASDNKPALPEVATRPPCAIGAWSPSCGEPEPAAPSLKGQRCAIGAWSPPGLCE
jgi:hypothetical protein